MKDVLELTKAGIDTDALTKRLLGNTALIPIFIEKFVQDKTFDALISAFESSDAKAAEMASHSLKGMCGNLSLDKLYALFSSQTDLIRADKLSDARDMMPEITRIYGESVSFMKLWLCEG